MTGNILFKKMTGNIFVKNKQNYNENKCIKISILTNQRLKYFFFY